MIKCQAFVKIKSAFLRISNLVKDKNYDNIGERGSENFKSSAKVRTE